MITDIKTDLSLYLSGGIKLKDVIAKHDISRNKAARIIRELSNLPIKLPMQRVRVPKPEKLHEMVIEQIEREKRVRITEEISQALTVPADWYKNSRLVNKERYYDSAQ